jgi:hypothetical protein
MLATTVAGAAGFFGSVVDIPGRRRLTISTFAPTTATNEIENVDLARKEKLLCPWFCATSSQAAFLLLALVGKTPLHDGLRVERGRQWQSEYVESPSRNECTPCPSTSFFEQSLVESLAIIRPNREVLAGVYRRNRLNMKHS